MSNYDINSYPYLDGQDVAFARCFRLTESEFLTMAGGLKKYTEFRLDRQQAKGATMKSLSGETMTFNVPPLPDNVEEAMSRIQLPGLKEEQYAATILKEQMDKVAGIIGALRANRELKDDAERTANSRTSARERDMSSLRKEAHDIYGWSEDSGSAKDWAEQKYQQRYSSWRGY
jgi:hypothetical protein